ncbi:hypothetical protein D1BOALGB6SA_7441 [Olavius sp. associated proteobacterium Delta 1]|nr:hypothetical protein D1BOALGB6SA_7441 [Olavius sp. associated proteobacterium Delta 1]
MKMKRIPIINLPFDLKTLNYFIYIAAAFVIVFAGGAWATAEKTSLKMDLPPPEVPQPQLFCGYCHVLTYPGIVQKGYELWKKGKHNKVGCVECHYPPGVSAGTPTSAATSEITKASHIPAQPPGHFSYLPLGGDTIRTRPQIADASCMTAVCHGKPDDKFKTKKIKFSEKVLFVHQPHLDEKKQIEGQQVNCVSCHQHETDQKKFEVSKASCHLCHFKNVRFNQDRGRCELCHELPTKPIQTSGEKPITHEILKGAGVSCASCHLDVIQGAGGAKYEAIFENNELKTAIVLGSGGISTQSCRSCHDEQKDLKEEKNKKLMHQKHVSVKNARCLECHQQIVHTKADLAKPADKGPALMNLKQSIQYGCAACHPEPHRYQRLLAEGAKRKDVFASPDPMYKARTNCMGCHVEKKLTKTGLKTLMASAGTCVQCHTKDHKKMLADWTAELAKEVKEAKEIEQEALDVLEDAKAKLSEDQLVEAQQMLAQGRANINIVQFGNGVHNKKYSLLLIDAAINKYDELIEFVEASE